MRGRPRGMVRQKIALKSAKSLFLMRRPAGPLPVSAATNGTVSLPTRYGLANVPSVIRRPCPLASDGLGPVSGGVVFSKLSKLLDQEDALSAPCLQHFRNYSATKVARCGSGTRDLEKASRFGLHQLRNCFRGDFCSPQARPRGAQECCGKA